MPSQQQKLNSIELKKKEPFRQDSILIFRTEEGEIQSSVSKSDMPPKKRPLLQGDNDGEGYPWKLVKASGAAGAHVFYGSDGRSMFKLKKGDQKAEPSEQRHRSSCKGLRSTATRRESSRTTKKEAAGRRPKERDSPQKQPLSLSRPRAACRRPARRKTAESRRRSHI